MARAGKRRYNFMGGSSSSSSLSEASSFICGLLWSFSLDRSVSLLVGRRWRHHSTQQIGKGGLREKGEQNGDLTRVVCRSFVFFFPLKRFAREEKILTSIASMLKKEGRKKRWLKEERTFLPSTLFSPLFTTCRKCQKSANTFKDYLEYTHREM